MEKWCVCWTGYIHFLCIVIEVLEIRINSYNYKFVYIIMGRTAKKSRLGIQELAKEFQQIYLLCAQLSHG